MGKLVRAWWFVWKVFVGGVLCQFWPTSILAIGWTYRLMQRTAMKKWWQLSSSPEKGETFGEWAEQSASADAHARFPNWVLCPGGLRSLGTDMGNAHGFRAKFRALRHGLLGSLWMNAVAGIQGIANVLVLTVVPALLLSIGWYSGWDNSFNKGYEQYYVGIALSWIGIVLFLGVMLYLPMAQARQAVTGEWRSFYQFRTVWSLVRRRRLGNLALAACYSLVSIPITILLKIVPYGVTNNNPAFDEMSSAQLLEFANTYFFWISVVGFLAYVTLRIIAARLYAGAVVEAFQKSDIGVAELGAIEGQALLELGLADREETRARNIAIVIVTKAARPAWATATVIATLLVWFSFIAQLYVSEFLNYHQRGLINQSLIQLPWFRYVPESLVQAAKEESLLTPPPKGELASISGDETGR